MRTIPQHHVCSVIPQHILDRLAAQPGGRGADVRATLVRTRELATGRSRPLIDPKPVATARAEAPRKRRSVYDAQHDTELPGKLVMTDHKSATKDIGAVEAFEGCGTMYDFLAQVFRRRSIDNRGMGLISSVHYGERFSNALWNGEQMVYGDGDGEIFNRFTASLDVIGHELTHGVTQFSAALGYTGQTGALNEHLSDAFGIMVKQWLLGLSAKRSDWLIGAELFGPKVNARGVRSMSNPGTAYDDPLLGRDPQPAHMADYVETDDDNEGVHINSGILNRAFYLAAVGIGGKTWEKVGQVWYRALTQRLRPDAGFHDFARATTDIAGELYGNGQRVQRVISEAWDTVGLETPIYQCASRRSPRGRRRKAAASLLPTKWRRRPGR